MAQLFGYNPSFNAELYRYHFESTFSKTLGYTQQELDYLAKKPVVDVYYETSWQPFEYEKDGQADGITPDVIRAIGEDTGIQFHFVLTPSTQDVYAGVGRDTEDAVMNFLRKYDLTGDFKLNIEANHATLAGHTFQHELRVAAINGAFGSIDANQGDLFLGWDTDQFPTDVYNTVYCMSGLGFPT